MRGQRVQLYISFNASSHVLYAITGIKSLFCSHILYARIRSKTLILRDKFTRYDMKDIERMNYIDRRSFHVLNILYLLFLNILSLLIWKIILQFFRLDLKVQGTSLLFCYVFLVKVSSSFGGAGKFAGKVQPLNLLIGFIEHWPHEGEEGVDSVGSTVNRWGANWAVEQARVEISNILRHLNHFYVIYLFFVFWRGLGLSFKPTCEPWPL